VTRWTQTTPSVDGIHARRHVIGRPSHRVLDGSVALYSDAVSPAALGMTALAAQVSGDMAEGEGVAWWDLDPARSILIGDYVVGLTESVQANLVEASMHATKARELWGLDSIATLRSMRTASLTGSGMIGKATETVANRRVEVDGHVAGFFRAAGSVMDNVGAIVVGVVGLRTSLVQAKWSDLKLDHPSAVGMAPSGPGHDLQVQAIDAIRSAVASGPAGWSEWTVDLRNTLVHRASRMTLFLADSRQPDGFLRPLPRHPAQTQTESMSQTARFGRDLVPEHAAETMAAILIALVALVSGTSVACVDAWDARRSNTDLVRQPQKQWPILKQGRTSTFRGAHPGTLPKFTNGSLIMHPTMMDRMMASHLLDRDRRLWIGWFASDEATRDRRR